MALDSFDTQSHEQSRDIDVRDPDEVAEYIAEQGWRTFHN